MKSLSEKMKDLLLEEKKTDNRQAYIDGVLDMYNVTKKHMKDYEKRVDKCLSAK